MNMKILNCIKKYAKKVPTTVPIVAISLLPMLAHADTTSMEAAAQTLVVTIGITLAIVIGVYGAYFTVAGAVYTGRLIYGLVKGGR
jgi:hypothetical protein